MIIGITGNFCAGKNSASFLFSEHGFRLIDVDRIGYDALEQEKEAIVVSFGNKVISEGKVDRGKLGRIVFSDQAERKKLESVVHPLMIRRVKEICKNERDVVINAALLIEMCLHVLCDFVIGIAVKEEIAVKRGIKRDGIEREEVLQRIRSQIPLKEKLHYVDIVIDNNGSPDELKRKVERIIRDLEAERS
jgi:dephospho-CoA kinase